MIIDRFLLARREAGLVVLEGLHALKHAHRFGAEILEAATAGEAATELARQLAPDLVGVLESATRVGAGTYARLSPRPHATGVIAIALRPRARAGELLAVNGVSPIVYLEDPSHLGNLGACVRVAAAAGAAGVLSSGTHDPWSPEAVRSAAGLHFAIPVARCEELPAGSRSLIALTPDGDPLGDDPIPAGSILAFGSERSGLSAGLLARANARRAIPMREGVSSLNLAVAVGVVLYAWRLGGRNTVP